MSELSLIPENLTMTSLEIAELTGKRHDNVMRDIRSMLVELHGEGVSPNLETPSRTRKMVSNTLYTSSITSTQ